MPVPLKTTVIPLRSPLFRLFCQQLIKLWEIIALNKILLNLLMGVWGFLFSAMDTSEPGEKCTSRSLMDHDPQYCIW